METGARVAFKHRYKPEGLWDSICLKCYLTVETAAREDDLTEAERRHDCAELNAERMGYCGRESGAHQDLRMDRRRS